MNSAVAQAPEPDVSPRKGEADADAPGRSRAPFIVAAAVVFLCVVGKVTTPAFLTESNILGVIRDSSVTGIAALGVTFVTIGGELFSLALEQTAALTGILFALLLNGGISAGPALLITAACIILTGVLQGTVVAAGANPIVLTLAVGTALTGVSSILTSNQTVVFQSSVANSVGNGRIVGVPVATWVFVFLVVVGTIVLKRTRFGRTLVFVGSNRRTAIASGLDPRRVTIVAFGIASAAAGVAGFMVAAQASQGTVLQQSGLNFDTAAAVLVGGNAIQGGDGSMIRTALGAILITLLENLAVIRGLNYGAQLVFEGMLVLITVSGYWMYRRRKALA